MHTRSHGKGKNYVALSLAVSALFLFCAQICSGISLTQSTSLAPAQAEIERQRQRLQATDSEERRDALMKLGAMRLAAASQAALVGLSDVSPMVRAVAAKAILSIEPDQSVSALTPLLSDKDEFVRREVAYALGLSRNRKATESLIQLLLADKEDGVRAAAAVALGDIADESAVVALSTVLAPQLNTAGRTKGKIEKNVFVLRAAAKSLGQIKSRAGVPALVMALTDEKLVDDVRREAAQSLGTIGDPSALPALRTASSSSDPYLAQTAFESLKKITAN